MNKKAQELSIGTLVLIVLGIIVLVLLVLGFSMGWENLFSKIGIFRGSDLSAIVSACQLAVSSQSQTSFCEFKKVKINSITEYVNCDDNRIKSSLNDNSLSGKCNSVQNSACINVIKNKGDIDKDKYNEKTCRQFLNIPEVNCADITINGVKAQIQGTCTGDQVDISGYVTTPTTGKCCIKLA